MSAWAPTPWLAVPDEPEIDAVRAAVLPALEDAHAAREAALSSTREATRHAANAIRAAHRQDHDTAADRLAASRRALAEARDAVAGHPRIAHAGFVFDAEKELAEAELTCATVAGEALPDPARVNVDPAAYLNGLAETVGELRRHALDRLRADDVAGADAALGAMEAMFGLLVEVDLPDGVTGGLRRATDVARGLVERTRGDVTAAVGQMRLRQALEAADGA